VGLAPDLLEANHFERAGVPAPAWKADGNQPATVAGVSPWDLSSPEGTLEWSTSPSSLAGQKIFFGMRVQSLRGWL